MGIICTNFLNIHQLSGLVEVADTHIPDHPGNCYWGSRALLILSLLARYHSVGKGLLPVACCHSFLWYCWKCSSCWINEHVGLCLLVYTMVQQQLRSKQTQSTLGSKHMTIGIILVRFKTILPLGPMCHLTEIQLYTPPWHN